MRSPDIAKLPSLVMTALEMQRRPAAFKRQALKEPVTITSNGEPILVVMSVEEYKGLKDGPGSIGVSQSSKVGYPPVMNRREAIERLLAHRCELEKLRAMRRMPRAMSMSSSILRMAARSVFSASAILRNGSNAFSAATWMSSHGAASRIRRQ